MTRRLPDQNVALTGDSTSVSFNLDRFDELIASQGVKLVHFLALPCPVGKLDRYDIRRVHEDHSGCSNGHLYTKIGEITALFVGNPNNQDQNDMGLKDGGTVNVTFPVTYDACDTEFAPLPYDRFYLNEEKVTVPHTQLVEAHETGRDRLSFPVVDVIHVVDSRGRSYDRTSFRIEDGQLVWVNGGLGKGPDSEHGTVYAVRYTYRPYWYVSKIQHQVRVAQVETQLARELARVPQQLTLQREYIFENEEKDPLAPDPDSPRQVKGPRMGGFSPR